MNDPSSSNWGRWGEDDERGTLNLIGPDVVAAALASVREGRVITLGAPVGPDGPVYPGRSPSLHTLRAYERHADDVLVLNTHSSSHLDALSHAFVDGLMYNNVPVAEVSGPDGMRRNAVDRVGAMVTRGVLLDIARFRGVDVMEPGDAITGDELDSCAASIGIELRRGDICLVRTGWIARYSEDLEVQRRGEPGLALDAAEWFFRRELVAIGADNGAIDVLPPEPGGQAYGLHPRIIQRQGGYLLEFLDLEELAAARATDFLLVVAPLKITGGAGSPINPVAIV
jgi:kynurenine formamidase